MLLVAAPISGSGEFSDSDVEVLREPNGAPG